MSAERWFATCDEILTKIRTTQLDSIRRAAELIADAGEAGGGLHFFDTGHCSHEPIHRAGGLLMIRRLNFGLNLETTPGPKGGDAVDRRRAETRRSTEEQLADIGVQRSGLAPGDALIVNSVSGKAALPVEVALSARRLGCKVIAITNITYSTAVESQHSSGKHLFEVADVVIDNCGVVGDAVLNVEGVGTGVAPTSGVAFCYIIWALASESVAQMQARGLHPHVYRSINLPDGEAFNARAEQAYRETGI
jgi:uncharacterized phosphosugar-binding protein